MTQLSRRGEIRLGFRCNARCGFCYYGDMVSQPQELEPSIESLRASLVALRRLGATEVEFTGGEPTIRHELADLVRTARNLGFVNISLITNGIQLARQKYAELLVEAGVNDVLFSVHGASAATHDAHTGVPGSYRKILAAISNMKSLGVRYRVSCTVTKQNVGEINEILASFLELNASAIHFAVFSPVASAENVDASLRVSYAEAGKALATAIDRYEDRIPQLSVKYIPFCYLRGYEKYVMNLYQQSFDPDDWNYYFSNRVRRAPSGWRGWLFDSIALAGCLLTRHPTLPFRHGLLGMKVYGLTRLVELIRKRRMPACRRCTYDRICDHVWRDYGDASDIQPIPGPPLNDPAAVYGMAAYRNSSNALGHHAQRRRIPVLNLQTHA